MSRGKSKSIGIEELKKLPCRRGHSRRDAYVNVNPFTHNIVLNCRQCRQIQLALKKIKQSHILNTGN